jgi:hypothetical protein
LLGSNFRVNDVPATTHSMRDPAVAADSSGNFVIVWENHSAINPAVMAQRYKPDGTPDAANFKVSSDDRNEHVEEPNVAMNDSGYSVVAWTQSYNSEDNFYAQYFDRQGIATGPNIKVNDAPSTSIWCWPGIAIDRDGNFVLTWNDDRDGDMDIFLQQFLKGGTPVGANIKVNENTGNAHQLYPRILLASTGNFTIIWGEWQDGSFEPHAQRFNSDGSKIGNNFKINSKDQRGADYWGTSWIAMDEQNRMVVAWAQDEDIFGQRFNEDWTQYGEIFRINSSVENFQGRPDIEIWNGRIYTVWSDKLGLGTNVRANVLSWDSTLAVKEHFEQPRQFELQQNYPNPFNPETEIQFQLANSRDVKLTIFNIIGQPIRTLADSPYQAGYHSLKWNGKDSNGNDVSSGVYLYNLQAGDFTQTKKMLLIR